MARFRLDTLTPEQSQKFNQFMQQYIPAQFHSAVLDSIDQNGTISDELLQKIGFDDKSKQIVAQQLKSSLPTLPSLQETLGKLTDTKQDFSTLTDQELKDRLQAFNQQAGILNPPQAQIEQKKNQLRDAIVSLLNSSKFRWMPPDNVNSLADQMANSIAIGRENPIDVINRFDLTRMLTQATPGDRAAHISDLIQQQAGAPFTSFQISDPNRLADLKSGEKNIQDILSGREKEATQTANVDKYIASLPEVLGANTSQYISGLRGTAAQSLSEELAPQVIENLNLRGLVDSGDLPSELARAYSSAYAPIEAEQAQLMAEDSAFFQNAGYNEALRKAIASGADVTSQIQAEQGQTAQDQANRFSASESRLSNLSQQDLLRRQEERAAAIAANRADIAARNAAKTNRSGLYSALGTAGGIGGGALLATSHPLAGGLLLGGSVLAGSGLFK